MSESATLEAPADATAPAHQPSDYAPSVPAGVRERAARADEMIRAAAAAAAAANGTPPTPAGGPGEAEPGVSQLERPADAGDGGTQPQPSTEKPLAPSPVDADQTAELMAELERAKQDIRTWKGRHDAETKRERERREAAEAKIAELEATLADSKREPESPMEPLSEEELDRYGEDLLNVAARFVMPRVMRALEVMEAKFSARLAEVEQKAGRANAAAATTEWEKYLKRLTDRLPTWEKVDKSDAFAQWLEAVDPIFGLPNRNPLDAAANAMDVERTALVYERFLSQQAASGSRGTTEAPAGATEPGTGVAPTAPTLIPAQPTLEDLAAPGKASPSQQPAMPTAKPGAKDWTVAEVRQFYGERARGLWRDREAEADRIEREIAAATREGRLR